MPFPRPAAPDLVNVLIAAWWKTFGDQCVSVRQAVVTAIRGDKRLRTALAVVAPSDYPGMYSAHRLGRWLARHGDTPLTSADGRAWRFILRGDHRGQKVWQLVPVARANSVAARVEERWALLIGRAIGDMTGRITSAEVYRILGTEPAHVPHTAGRLGEAMRELGFEHKLLRGGRRPNPRWFYVRGATMSERLRDIIVTHDAVSGAAVVSYADTDDDLGTDPCQIGYDGAAIAPAPLDT